MFYLVSTPCILIEDVQLNFNCVYYSKTILVLLFLYLARKYTKTHNGKKYQITLILNLKHIL